jgi:hypothetical protein
MNVVTNEIAYLDVFPEYISFYVENKSQEIDPRDHDHMVCMSVQLQYKLLCLSVCPYNGAFGLEHKSLHERIPTIKRSANFTAGTTQFLIAYVRIFILRSWDKSVGIGTGYGLDGWGSFPSKSKICLFSTAYRLALGPNQPPIR